MTGRKTTLLLFCLLACLLLTGCDRVLTRSVNPLAVAAATLVPDTSPVLPQLRETQPQHTRDHATLFFRFGDEPYLAPESRAIAQSASQPFEQALISQLTAGPGTQRTELRGLFPEGTRVISTLRQGRTLFVTLSSEIMNAYPDEPAAWQNDEVWKTEVPLRRRLCMQSLVATVTENCDVDQVQVLVHQPDSPTSSLRIQQRYFRNGADPDEPVGPMTRDASLILGPDTTLQVILTCWHEQDWQRLYQFIAAQDPQYGFDALPLTGFVLAMKDHPPVVRWERSSATIDFDGSRATFAVDFTLLAQDGLLRDVNGRTIRLYRVNDLWKTSLAQLTGWLEE